MCDTVSSLLGRIRRLLGCYCPYGIHGQGALAVRYLGDFASCPFCNCAVFVRHLVRVLKRGTCDSLTGIVVVFGMI